jgi:hypothetical protein
MIKSWQGGQGEGIRLLESASGGTMGRRASIAAPPPHSPAAFPPLPHRSGTRLEEETHLLFTLHCGVLSNQWAVGWT